MENLVNCPKCKELPKVMLSHDGQWRVGCTKNSGGCGFKTIDLSTREQAVKHWIEMFEIKTA